MKNSYSLSSLILTCWLLTAGWSLALAQPSGHSPIIGIFNVMDYGAKGDGTTDDTVSIQAAQTAAEALSVCGTLFFPPSSTYLIHTGPVKITKESCAWYSVGGNSYSDARGATIATDMGTITFTGSTSGSTLTTTSTCTGGTLAVGEMIQGNGVTTALGAQPFILSLTSGTPCGGGTVVWALSQSVGSHSSGSMTATPDAVLSFVSTGGQFIQMGPHFENLNFVATGNTRQQNLLHAIDSNHLVIRNVSFVSGAAGFFYNGIQDYSNTVLDTVNFYNNVVGWDMPANSTTGGENSIQNSYIQVRNSGDIGVRCIGGSSGGLRVVNNRIDGFTNTSNGLPFISATGIWAGCDQVSVMGNMHERGPDPFVYVDQSGGGNWGRGVTLLGNLMEIQDQAIGTGAGATPQTVTCNTTSSSPTLSSCTTATPSAALADIIVGMEVKQLTGSAAGIPLYTRNGTANQWYGGAYVTAVNAGASTVTLSLNATASITGATFAFCQPIVHLPPNTTSFPVSFVGNTYIFSTQCGFWGTDGN